MHWRRPTSAASERRFQIRIDLHVGDVVFAEEDASLGYLRQAIEIDPTWGLG